jgi:hypothetical protein
MKKMTKAEMITAAETLYIECYKELNWAKKNLGETGLTERYRTRWAAMYEMLKQMGVDPASIAVKRYEEIFAK